MYYALHKKAIQHWQSKKSSRSIIEYPDEKSDDSDLSLILCKERSSNRSTTFQSALAISCSAEQNDSSLELVKHISIFGHTSDLRNQSQYKPSEQACDEHDNQIHQIFQNSGNLETKQLCSTVRDDETVSETSNLNKSCRPGRQHLKAGNSSLYSFDGITSTDRSSNNFPRVDRPLGTIRETYLKVGDGVTFKRFFGDLADCHLRALNGTVIERRKKSAKNLLIDVDICKDLDGVEEWDINQPIPPENQITQDDIDQIKKGMMNGKLYNIGCDHIRKIFQDYSFKSTKTTRNRFQSRSGFKCPLCSRSYRDQTYVLRHIESLHTMSLIVCIHCGAIGTSKRTCQLHRCKSMMLNGRNNHLYSFRNSTPETASSKSIVTMDCALTETCKGQPLEKYQHTGSKSFKRFFGSSDDCRNPGCYHQMMKRRKSYLMNLDPDEDIFEGLVDIEEWDEERRMPLPDRVKVHHSMSIKKGMMNGRLYNIGYQHLEILFPDMSKVPNKSESYSNPDGYPHRSRFRCPLCSKTYQSRGDVRSHMESLHTMNMIVCSNCNTLFTRKAACNEHRCGPTIFGNRLETVSSGQGPNSTDFYSEE